ncbi:MAG: tetratricopeptide repeat protein [Deltaproteobacteria bacterium]|nr:tetratricopeptide repeat protein [Deltaproteobacteria bacterium]
MRKHQRWSFVIVASAVLAGSFAAHAAQPAKKKDASVPKFEDKKDVLKKREKAVKTKGPEQKLDDPFERNKPLILEKEKAVQEKRAEAVEALKRILDKNPDHPQKARILFNQAELYWEETKYFYFLKRRAFEDELDAWLKKGNLKAAKPAEPKADYGRSLTLYKKITREFPDYEKLDEVVFRLGDGLWAAGKEAEAVPYFQQVVTKFKKSPYVAEAQLALAEFFFMKDLFFAAQRKYEEILAMAAGKKVHNFALYKLAWTFYNLGGSDASNYRKSTDTFKKVIGNLEQKTARSEIEFREQAMKDIVISLAEVPNGFEETRDYFKRLGGHALMMKMLDRLAKYYLSQDKDEKAIAIYRYFISLDPWAPIVPDHLDQIVDSLKRIGDKRRLEKAQRAIISLFAPEGEWVKKNEANPQAVAKAVKMAEDYLDTIITNLHKEAIKTNDLDKFKAVAKDYALYLAMFLGNAKSYDKRFYLAEIQFFKLNQYETAMETYAAVVADKRETKFQEEGAYGRILCAGKLGGVEEGVKREFLHKKYSTMGKAQKLKGMPLSKWEAKYVEASDEYAKLLPKSTKAIPVSFNAAEMFMRNKLFDEAVRRYSFIVDNHPDHELAGHSANNILECFNQLEDWPEIEKWSKKLLANKRFKGRKPDELNRFVAMAIFKVAYAAIDRGDWEKGASEYLRLVKEQPGSDFADKALVAAAETYIAHRQPKKAIAAYDRVWKEFPKKEAAPRAIFAIADIATESANYELAAQYFEKMGNYPRDKEAGNSIFNAGVMKEILGDTKGAVASFEKYVKTYGQKDAVEVWARIAVIHFRAKDVTAAEKVWKQIIAKWGSSARAIEAHLKLGLGAQKRGKAREAEGHFKSAVAKYKRLPEAARGKSAPATAWAARARYEEGRALFAQYATIKFKLPQKVLTRLIVEKGKLLKKVTEIFFDVLNYKSAAWSACALQKIGDTYQDFATALFETPVPPGLSPEEIEVYKIKLQEKAFPVEEKALEAHAKNLNLSVQAKVYNGCVEASGAKLAKARPDDYPRVTDDVVSAKHFAEPVDVAIPELKKKKTSMSGQDETAGEQ